MAEKGHPSSRPWTSQSLVISEGVRLYGRPTGANYVPYPAVPVVLDYLDGAELGLQGIVHIRYRHLKNGL